MRKHSIQKENQFHQLIPGETQDLETVNRNQGMISGAKKVNQKYTPLEWTWTELSIAQQPYLSNAQRKDWRLLPKKT